MSEENLCGTPGLEAAHTATLRRMIAEAPPCRTEASPDQLVHEFANSEHRMGAYLALYARGMAALPAIRDGFGQANWQVRKWCVMFADNFADIETLQAVIPLLQDPNSDVRVAAVHSISCESCKDGANPIDAVRLLLERIEHDDSIKVRRQAAGMLAHHRTPDTCVVPVFRHVLANESDRKLRLHAEQGLERYTASGLA